MPNKAKNTKKASKPAKKTKVANKVQSPKKKAAERKLSKSMKAGLEAVAALKPAREGKTAKVIELLKRPEGATMDDMVAATGWKNHSVRALLSDGLRKKRGLQIVSDKPQDGQRIYKIAD